MIHMKKQNFKEIDKVNFATPPELNYSSSEDEISNNLDKSVDDDELAWQWWNRMEGLNERKKDFDRIWLISSWNICLVFHSPSKK